MNKEISFLTLSRDHFKKSLNEFGDLKESLKKGTELSSKVIQQIGARLS